MKVNSKTTFDEAECEVLRNILRSYEVARFIRAHINDNYDCEDVDGIFERLLIELEHATSITIEADYSK